MLLGVSVPDVVVLPTVDRTVGMALTLLELPTLGTTFTRIPVAVVF